MIACEAVLTEHAQLVARGVRTMALAGHVPAEDDLTALRLTSLLDSIGTAGAIPFLCDAGGMIDYGFASHAWVIDLYKWAVSNDAVPLVQRHRIIGLLLGYDAEAVRSFEEQESGRFYPNATPLREQAAK